MGQRYVVSRENATPTAGQDILTAISASGRRLRLVDFNVGGAGSSSAAQRFQVGRSSAGTTPGGAITPSKAEHTDQPAATFTTATTWSVQPTLETNSHEVVFNALGGPNRLPGQQGRPNGISEARNGENISIRCPAGVTPQACSISATFEED